MGEAINIQEFKTEPVRHRLQAWMEESGSSISATARSVGKSESVISEWLRGKYKGDSDAVARQVESFLTRQAARESRPGLTEFVKTKIARDILIVIKLAHEAKDMAIIYGDAGSGKTFTAKHYAAEVSGCVYISATHVKGAPKAVLQTLAAKLKVAARLTAAELYDEVVKVFMQADRLLIVDEAQHLSTGALETIRGLHDETGVPVVMLGNDWVLTRMRGSRAPAFAQILSRVGVQLNVQNSRFEREELRPIVEKARGDKAVLDKFTAQAVAGEGLRKAVKILGHAMLIAGDEKLTIEHWEAAVKFAGGLS
jgi:DNA transposition AAA+ family ATPase